jgi:hypothetical protein
LLCLLYFIFFFPSLTIHRVVKYSILLRSEEAIMIE